MKEASVGDIAVIFGGPSPEHDVSILTGLQAVRELTKTKSVVAIYWTKTGSFVEVDATLEASAFADGVPKASSPVELRIGVGFVAEGKRLSKDRVLDLDAAILCTHGGPGEDGTLQGALDLAGISYAGPSVAGAAIGMDKLAFSSVLSDHGIAVLPRRALTEDLDGVDFDGPYIVKPRFGGSSIGIDVVADFATAKARLSTNVHLRSGAVIEPFRADLADLQIAVRTYPTLQLSAIERPIKTSNASEILDYRDKYIGGEGMASAPRELPATLSSERTEQVHAAARAVASLASIRGVARIDFMEGEAGCFVNEVNTIPGSLARYLFIEPPVSFGQLLSDLVAEAIERPTHRYSSAGADGLVLRGAASIAAKLA
jgi:D-alanine-D-alanine ligase